MQPFVQLGLAVVLVATVTLSLGLAPVFTLATDLVVGAAPPERAGVAAAISETGSEFGGAMGIAILGSIGTAVYRAGIGGEAAASIPARRDGGFQGKPRCRSGDRRASIRRDGRHDRLTGPAKHSCTGCR